MKKKIKCFVCHKEINEEEDYVFMGKTVHKGECLKSMIDEYNAVRNLQIRNKRLCAEIERLNNKIHDISETLNETYNDRTELRNENNRLNIIIKDVREYIENAFATGEEIFKVEILEILDKGE